MGTVNLGNGSSIGIKVESTWGTAVAPERWLAVYNAAVTRKPQIERVGTMGRRGGLSFAPRRHFLSGDLVDVSAEWPVAYDDASLYLIESVLKNTTTGAGDPYTHTYGPYTPSTEIVGMSFEHIGGYGAFNDAEVAGGVVGDSLVLSCEAGKIMRGRFAGIGKTTAGLAAASTPTYNDAQTYVHGTHGGNLTWSAASFADTWESFQLTVKNNRIRRRANSSDYTAKPALGDFEAELQVVREWDATTLTDAFYAQTQGDVTIAFDGPTTKGLTITLHEALLLDAAHPTQTRGIIRQTLRFRGHATAAKAGLSLAWTNANSSNRAA
jgi:hypothetical protein